MWPKSPSKVFISELFFDLLTPHEVTRFDQIFPPAKRAKWVGTSFEIVLLGQVQWRGPQSAETSRDLCQGQRAGKVWTECVGKGPIKVTTLFPLLVEFEDAVTCGNHSARPHSTRAP